MKNDVGGVDIVMFNMSTYTDWQKGVPNRNFHVLHNLLKDPRVRKIVAVDYLPFTLKRAVKQLLYNVWGGVTGKVLARGVFYKLVKVSQSEIARTGYDLSADESDKLWLYSDVRSYWSEGLVYKNLQSWLNNLNISPALVWSYLPTFVGYADNLKNSGLVFDAVDNWLEHSGYKKIKSRLVKNYKFLEQRAKYIFTTSLKLVEFFGERDNCEYVPNGVVVAWCQSSLKIVDKRLLGLAKPLMGYVGVITKDRVDIDLLAYLAQKNPQKTLVLVGPVWADAKVVFNKKLKPLANVRWLGCLPHQEALAVMREFDVGLLPNLFNSFNQFTDPLKLYEYLACGLPVVSAGYTFTGRLKEFVYQSSNPEEFNSLIQRAVVENNESLRKYRREAVASYAWDKLVARMLRALPIFEDKVD